jgi:hypothetical protein
VERPKSPEGDDIDDVLGYREELTIHSILYQDAARVEKAEVQAVSRYTPLDDGIDSIVVLFCFVFVLFFFSDLIVIQRSHVPEFVRGVYSLQEPASFSPFSVPARLYGDTKVSIRALLFGLDIFFFILSG